MLAGGVFAAVPSVRDAVLEFFGLQGATVERREQLPAAPRARAAPARRADHARARARASSASSRSCRRAAGRPDGVYVTATSPGGELSLDLPRRDPGSPRRGSTGLGLLVDEFRGDLAPEYIGQDRRPGDRASSGCAIDGERAIWLEGAPHFFFYRPPDRLSRSELRPRPERAACWSTAACWSAWRAPSTATRVEARSARIS